MKTMLRAISLALVLLLTIPLMPAAQAAYGVVYIPESAYDLDLPDRPNPGWEELEFGWDPFLTGMAGCRAWVRWENVQLPYTAADTEYVCSVSATYPEGNYIVAVTAYYRNDREKTLISYKITYQTNEFEFYTIYYFGHNYRERTGEEPRLIYLTDEEKAQAWYKTDDYKQDTYEERQAARLKQKAIDMQYGQAEYEDQQEDVYYYDSAEQKYKPATLDAYYDTASGKYKYNTLTPQDLKNNNKYYMIDTYFTPSPDAIYYGEYTNGFVVLRNGSGKYFGTANWFEWDYYTGAVTRSPLEGLRRLFSFPSPRVRERYEANEE